MHSLSRAAHKHPFISSNFSTTNTKTPTYKNTNGLHTKKTKHLLKQKNTLIWNGKVFFLCKLEHKRHSKVVVITRFAIHSSTIIVITHLGRNMRAWDWAKKKKKKKTLQPHKRVKLQLKLQPNWFLMKLSTPSLINTEFWNVNISIVYIYCMGAYCDLWLNNLHHWQ